MSGSSVVLKCNDAFQCTSSYKPCPLRHANQLGLPDFSACNIEKTNKKKTERPGYEATSLALLIATSPGLMRHFIFAGILSH